MTEFIKKLHKVRDNIAGKTFHRRANDLPSFYQTGNDFPAMNVLETDEGYRVDLAIPGFSKKDVNIITDNDILSIKVNYKGEEGRSTDSRESHNEFSMVRKICIPDEIDKQNISASMDNGLLKINMPAKNFTLKNKKASIEVE